MICVQFYQNPQDQYEPGKLPDGEVFYVPNHPVAQGGLEPGWYWQACYPGCLPDSEPVGPFRCAEAAIEDAREVYL